MNHETQLFPDFTISWRDVELWLNKYGKTERNLFLHPEDLEYLGERGHKIRPLNTTLLNIDTLRVDSAKELYFSSKHFLSKDFEVQLAEMERLGVNKNLLNKLKKKRVCTGFFKKYDVITPKTF
jgi:hypothetical protein